MAMTLSKQRVARDLCKAFMTFQFGMRHARTAKRVPSEQKWSADMLQDVIVTPWEVHIAMGPGIVLQ